MYMDRYASHKNSRILYRRSLRYLPGGVNSPVRAFKAVGGTPLFFTRGHGAFLYDVDGNRYLDYVGSWGPAILGHGHPRVVQKVQKAAARGLSFGASTEAELLLARMIARAFPSITKVRLVNSGTEATMSALRLARGYTGREKVVKFDGCYHGHADSFLVKAGSGAATCGIPDSAGIARCLVRDTISLPYNDASAVVRTFEKRGKEIAALIVEPIAGNMGLVLPRPDFLETIREVTRYYRTVLIFDEVITGFRVCCGGAQQRYGITPDITCLGKIIGGGLPIGAYGGARDLMDQVSPKGPVYQAGTLSGNPLATAAGIETLSLLTREGVYDRLERITRTLCEGIEKCATSHGIPVHVTQCGSLFTLFFSPREVTNYQEARACNLRMFAHYFHYMLEEGIYLPPSQFETCFVSLAHTPKDIARTIAAADRAFILLKKRKVS